MSKARQLRCRQLKRVPLVVVVGPQVDRVAFPSAFRHPYNVGEKAEALLQFGRQQLQVAQVRHVHYWFSLHTRDSNLMTGYLCGAGRFRLVAPAIWSPALDPCRHATAVPQLRRKVSETI